MHLIEKNYLSQCVLWLRYINQIGISAGGCREEGWGGDGRRNMLREPLQTDW